MSMDEKTLARASSIQQRDDSHHDKEDGELDTVHAPSGASTPAVTLAPDGDDDYPDGGLRAWLMILGTFCITSSTFGFTNSWGTFQSLYERDRLKDVPPSTIAWIGSLQYALVFFPGLLTGRYFDQGYFRVPMLFWSCILVISCFLIAECTEYWHFLLVQGVMAGLACGCLFGPALSTVTHWWKKRRSFAFGVTAVGSSFGGTAIPILVRNLEQKIGFAWSLRVVGFIIAALLTVSNLTLRRRLPPSPTSGSLVDVHAFKMPAYSIYVASTFFCFFGIYAVLTYIDIGAVSHGIDPDLSFYLVAIANAASGVGRLVSGSLGDRYGATNTIVPTTLLAAIMTYSWPFATTLGSTIAVALIYGFSTGAYVALLVVPLAHMGDHRDIGKRTGMQNTIMALSALAGPPTCGAIASAAGSYVPLGVFAGSMIVLGVVLMLVAKRAATGSWIRAKF